MPCSLLTKQNLYLKFPEIIPFIHRVLSHCNGSEPTVWPCTFNYFMPRRHILNRRGGLQEFWQLKLIKILTTCTLWNSLRFLSKTHRKVKDENPPPKKKYFYPPAWNIQARLVSFAAWSLPEKLLTKIPLFSTVARPQTEKSGRPIESANLFLVNKAQGLFPRPAASSHLLRRRKAGWLAYLFISLFYKGVTNWAGFLDLVPTLFLIRECDFYNPNPIIPVARCLG